MISHSLHKIKDVFPAVGEVLVLLCLCVGFLGGAEAVEAKVYEGDGVYFYGIQNDATPYTKDYLINSNSFGATTTTAIGSTTPIVSVVKSSPTKPELIAGYVNASGTLQVMCYDGTTWSQEWSATVGGAGTTTKFDIGYETSTGNAMVLYSSNASSSNELVYRTKTGTSTCGTGNWSAATNVDPVRSSGVVLWVKIATDPRATSSLMTAIWADSNRDLSAMTWSGSAWGNEHSAALETDLEVVSVAQDTQSFDVAYESLSGDVMVVWGSGGTNGTNGGYYAVCTGGIASCTWASVRTAMPTFLDDATHISLAADPLTDRMAFASIGNAGSDFQLGIWSGTGWTNTANVDISATAPTAGRMFVATGWLTNGGTSRAVAVYYDSVATNIGWYTHNGTSWSLQTDSTPTISFGTQTQYKIEVNPHDRSQLMFIVSNSTRQAFAKRLSMNSAGTFTWSQPDSGRVVSGLGSDIYRSMDFAYWRYVTPDFIGGTLYTDLGITTASSGKTIKLAVGTTTPTVYSTTTDASGVWRISEITDFSAISTTTPFIAWLDGDASDATTLYTGYVSGDISDIPLYYDYTTIYASSSSTTVDIASYGVYDATDDADILFNVIGSTTTISSNLLISRGTVTPTNSLVVAGDYTNNGTFTAGSGLVVFSGSNKFISGRLTGSSALNTAVITGSYTIATTTASTSNLTVEAGASLTATGTMGVSSTLTNRGTLLLTGGNVTAVDFITATSASTTAPSTLRLSGDFTNSGDFIAGTGTVLLTGVGQVLTSAATTTFYNLTKSVTSADTLTFGAGGEYAVSGTVTLTGLENNLLTLRSSTPGQFWYIDAQATRTIAWLDVQDSYNTDAASMSCPPGCLDSGNNINWFILTLYGTIYSDEGVTELTNGGLTVSARIEGVTYSTTTSAGTGYWYISGYPSPITASSVVPIWIDNSSTYKAALFARANGAVIPDANLYLDHVILRDDTGTTSPLLNTHVSGYAGGDDVDLLLTFGPEVTTDATLYIYDNTYYQADTELILGASLKAADTARTDFSAVNVAMTSTSTATITGVPLLGNVEFSGVGGEFSFGSAATTSNLTVATTSNLTVAEQIKINGNFVNDGTVTATNKLRFNGNFTNNGDFITPSGRLIFEGSNKTIGGRLTGTSTLGDVAITGSYEITSGTASATNMVIASSSSLVTTGSLDVSGAFSNQGSIDIGSLVAGGVSENMSPLISFLLPRSFLEMKIRDNFLFTITGGSENQCSQTSSSTEEVFGYSWESVAYGNNTYVAVGYTGASRVMTSSDGVTWTARSAAGDDDSWISVTYGNGLFVAVACGGSGGCGAVGGDRLMTSPDGITWTARPVLGDNDYWTSVTYGNGLFVAVSCGSYSGCGRDGDRVMTSPDGITWTVQTAAGTNESWWDVTYGNGLFVAVSCGSTTSGCGSGTSNRVMTSPDGINWTSQVGGVYGTESWRSVVYGNGIFVAVASAGVNSVMTSSDGVNWTNRPGGLSGGWFDVTYGNGLFVAVSCGGCGIGVGDRVMTSSDGVTWTARSAVGRNDIWRSIAYGGGLFVAVGHAYSNNVMTSSDGFIWEGPPTTEACEIQMYDVSSSTNPVFVAGMDISGSEQGTSTGSYSELEIEGDYMYLGKERNDTACSQVAGSAVGCELQIYDISSSTNPVYVAGRDANASPTGSSPSNYNDISALHISGNGLYVGKNQNSIACSQIAGSAEGCELQIYDISSSTNPVYVAGRDSSGSATGTATNGVNSLLRNGNSLYVGIQGQSVSACSSVVGAAANCELQIYDISSSTNPVYVAGRDSSGSATGTDSGYLYHLIQDKNYLYTVRSHYSFGCSQVAGSAGGCELQVYDISSSTNPMFLAGMDANGSKNGTSSNNRVFVEAYYHQDKIYLGQGASWLSGECSVVASGNRNIGCEMLVVDVSNPRDPHLVSVLDTKDNYFTLASDAGVGEIIIHDGYLYISKERNANEFCEQGYGRTIGCNFEIRSLETFSQIRGEIKGTNSFTNFNVQGPVIVADTASSTDLDVRGNLVVLGDMSVQNVHFRSGSSTISNALTITGDYQNDADVAYASSTAHVIFAGASAQSISGNLSGASAFDAVTMRGLGNKNVASSLTGRSLYIDENAEAFVVGDLQFAQVYSTGTLDVSGEMTSRSGVINTGMLSIGGSALVGKYTNYGTTSIANAATFTGNFRNENFYEQVAGELTLSGVIGDVLSGRTALGATTSVDYSPMLSLARSGDFLYVGLEDWTSSGECISVVDQAEGCELQVYDISDISNPVFVTGRDIIGSATGTDWGRVNHLEIVGEYLYVGSAGWDATACSPVPGLAAGCEIQIYDISDPANPVYTAGIDADGSPSGISAVGIYDMLVDGSYLYVAKLGANTACSQIAGSASGCQVQVYDISNPIAPVYLAGRSGDGTASGNSWSYMYSLALHGDHLYAGGEAWYSGSCGIEPGTAKGCELLVFDVSSSTNPIYVSGRDIDGSSNGNTSNISWVYEMHIIADTLYVGHSGTFYDTVQIYNVASSSNPVLINALDLSGYTWAEEGAYISVLETAGDTLYVAKNYGNDVPCLDDGSYTGCELLLFNIASTTNPVFVAGKGNGEVTDASQQGITDLVFSADGEVIVTKFSDYSSTCTLQGEDTTSGCSLEINSIAPSFYVSSTSVNNFGRMKVAGKGITFSANATTSDLTIEAGAVVEAPAELVVRGDFINQGRFNAKNGTTTFAGTGLQTATGTLASTSAFNNLVITNTSGNGNGTQSVVFTGPLKVNDTFKMAASSSAAFAAGATTTLQNISLEGGAGQYVWLRSTETGNPWKLDAPGERREVRHVNVKDSNACNGNPEISAVDGTSVDAGGNSCWDFGNTPGALSLQSVSDQTFTINQAAAEISPIVVTSASGTAITATDDLRITIATTSVDMRFDVTDTIAGFEGVAAAKVSTTVSYEDEGATLVLNVLSDFAADDVISISGLSYTDFGTINAAAAALTLYTGGASDVGVDATDTNTVTIVGALTLADHGEGQVADGFAQLSRQEIPLYRYTLEPVGETIRVHTTSIVLDGVNGIVDEDVTNLKLYKDTNRDGNFDGGDTLLANAAAFSLVEQSGSITFSTTYNISTTTDIIVIGDVANIRPDDQMNVRLNVQSITATGLTTSGTVIPSGAASRIQHNRGGGGTRSIPSLSAIGGDAPAGGSNETGGEETGGDNEIGVDTNTGGTELTDLQYFSAPSQSGTPLGEWVSGTNGINSDGVYTTASTTNLRQSFGGFTFGIPGSNEILGIEVKIEASATTNAGEIEIKLSWNGGSTQTTAKTTGTLTNLDAIYTLGGSADLWGHAWTPANLSTENFNLEIIGQPNTNTVQVDAIRVRIYHQATGGGVGGGGGEVRRPGLLPLAGAQSITRRLTTAQRTELITALSTLETTLRTLLSNTD